jgi:bifunctional DNase/RNase
MDNDKLELKILGISSGHTNASYTLILEEVEGNRKLPVVIGAFEAQAIAIQIEQIEPPRPMTHDLFKAFADSFEVGVEEVVVHKLQEGVFYANIRCKDQNGETQDLDARTSDAIAVGVRFDCPIYTYESIMEEAGIYLSESGAEEFQQSGTTPPEAAQPAAASAPSSEREPMKDEDLTEMSTTDLNDRLNQAIEAEDYIMAAKIRDEINRRKGEED